MNRAMAVGRAVHYVEERDQVCRAALVTAHSGQFEVDLAVFHPHTGLYWASDVVQCAGNDDPVAGGARCQPGGRAYVPGTWHWPEEAKVIVHGA